MVVIAQLVRASDCGSEGRGFEPHCPPLLKINIISIKRLPVRRPFLFKSSDFLWKKGIWTDIPVLTLILFAVHLKR
jgi:hypothetical protein